MLEVSLQRLIWRTETLHGMMLRGTTPLSEEQIYWQPGPQAPPIGWHLWHVARWADVIQAALVTGDEQPQPQFWEHEKLAEQWGLDATRLGPVQTGEGMNVPYAKELPCLIGHKNILAYAERSFGALNTKIHQLSAEDYERVLPNVQAYTFTDDGRIVSAPPQEAPQELNLMFHISHGSRHLGMIEALRGVQGMFGSVSN